MKIRNFIFVISILAITKQLGKSQTCCSGGVPISTNIGFTTEEKGILHIALSADYNNLASLYAGDQELNNNNRKRNTNAYFLRLGYDITNKWSVEGMLPYVIQKRAITQNSGSIIKDNSTGIGDIVLLSTYQILKQEINLSLSAGVKLDNGSFSEVNSDGLLLINDLQPGSGSIDGLFRMDVGYAIPGRPNSKMYAGLSYQLKGTNKEYLSSLAYTFGNEIQSTIGISSQELIFGQIFNPSIGLRYRNRTRDKIDSFELNNTGGTWIMAQFGIGWSIKKDTQVSVLFDVPVYQNIDGTQLSNDYILNFSFYQKLKL